jgi:hypothetical protein
LLILSLVLLAGLVLPAWAQPPPAPAVPQVELPGVGKLEMLPDVADGDWVFFGKLTPDDPGALRLTLALLYDAKSGDHYELRLTGKEAQFYLVRGGKTQSLGSAGAPGDLLKAGQMTEVSVRRDGWTLSLLLGGRLVCWAQDSAIKTGGVGYALGAGKLADPLLQFLGDMGFSDDFMRASGERSLWQPVAGQWQEESLRIDPQASTMQETKSANAFSYLGKAAQGRALTVAGYWFWSNYRLSASVRPLGGGACGLLAYYRDPDNYLALRWTPRNSPAPDGNRLQIIQRVAGQDRVLADTPGGFRAEQWYKLGLTLADGWVHAYLDDEERLSARNAVFRQGQCGLLEEGAAGVNFDDVSLSPWGFFADDFTGGERWDVVSGKWDRGDGRYTATAGGLLIGPPCAWSHYAISADAHVEKGAAGVVFGYVDAKNYWLVRYSLAGGNPRVELVQVDDGQEKLVASSPTGRLPGLALSVGAEVDDNLLTAQLGDDRLFRALLPAPPAGRLGLYASTGGTWFSFTEAQRIDPPPPAHVTKEFLDDKEHWEMAQWSTRRSPWIIPPALQVEREGNMILRDFTTPAEFGNNVWWTKGDYYGDKTVSFKIPSFGVMTGTARVILDSRPGENGAPVGGYTLALSAKAGSQDLGLALTAGDKPLGGVTVKVEGDECKVDYSRSGPYLQVRVNDKLVLQATVSG